MQQGNDYLAENRGTIMKGISKNWSKRTLAVAVLSTGLIISQGAAASTVYSTSPGGTTINTGSLVGSGTNNDTVADFVFGGLDWTVNIQWTGNRDCRRYNRR
jgi:hypothetical protein